MASSSSAWQLLPRQDSDSTGAFLELISDPFQSQIQQTAFLSSLGTSLLFTLAVALVFCLLRPYNTVVYAPRSRHADEKHAPPPVGKGLFAWITPVRQTNEQQLVEKVGLDAAIFLRFTRMCRNIFLALSVLGCGILIPVNVLGGRSFRNNNSGISAFMTMTPQFMWGNIFWAFVICSYLFTIVICYFLWHNYRAVVRLRRDYFNSPEYQASLHARTLMLTDIPKSLRTDEGIVKIIDDVKPTAEVPRAAIARNAKDLPELVEEHEEAVKELERHLAKYLRNPNKLPAKRPTCKASKNDASYKKGETVDAIDYLTDRIRELEAQIREARESVDKRNAMPYGFASYESIDTAHSVAHASKHKHPEGSTIRLAPKPNDLIWRNLPLSRSTRRWKSVYTNGWVAVLTALWIVPNALIAIFLTNLSNIGKVWPAFQTELNRNPTLWAIIQGIASPAITSAFYFYLPAIFRRLSIRAGDLTKTSRERNVTHKLFLFFLVNNLIAFSIFSAIFGYVSNVIQAKENNSGTWDALQNGHIFTQLMVAFCNVSPFWVTWLLQRNLGAAVDLSQLFNLAWGSFSRKFLSPTPRQLIELSAPQPFDYAGYYNYFLFYASVALVFASYQPLVLPVAALYFYLDGWLKKYLLLYVFITKYESGGMFWRLIFNRFLIATLLGNILTALLIYAQGYSWTMLGCMLPLAVILGGFKWYCMKTFDDAIHFYSTGTKDPEDVARIDKTARKGDRVAVRFGDPVLYKPLITPMVHAKARHLLGEIYRGRLSSEAPINNHATAYSDTFSLHDMSATQPGKAEPPSAPFEIVAEADLDFENYKNRPEFKEEFGGDGEMYGRPSDIVRPGTPGSVMTGGMVRSGSRDSERTYTAEGEAGPGTSYPKGYHQTPYMRTESPAGSYRSADVGDQSRLVGGASPMGVANPGWASAAMVGSGYSQVGVGTPDEDTSYDYFRRGRQL
ncbi:hypothetical protein H2201_001772 [Coniosporium apollinis]|uniref:DUF221-domain-containing protein n=1 Tax=Coniosporium apollinis TaxID=61459 RepID=A0ABQ9P034_9PEZI|nr:hypothetical protein H2201_001772 [Coniosporium apollinis]